ncbi:17292_t:CDS:2 [Funneliformis geosporum]|uniref:17292_t:CDS:1 n=1 Tax=Funneliformis geosporum TaxID=1117311 RepID=A0A9W4SZL7_9GLOM|nr:17292_t:CDS:2 [Funneliformis geosporum]
MFDDSDEYNFIIQARENANIKENIYTGEVDLTTKSDADILRLLVASDKLELFKYVQDHLIEKQTRDDLQIEEAVAWDYLIKWGIEQTLNL